MNRSCSLLIVFSLDTPIGIYRVSIVYLSYIYRVSTVYVPSLMAVELRFRSDSLRLRRGGGRKIVLLAHQTKRL